MFTIHAKMSKNSSSTAALNCATSASSSMAATPPASTRSTGTISPTIKKSGNITAHGEVQIDLESNPTGLTAPDQATPTELKNPIHLKTRDLIFNRNSGDASTDARVDFRTPQATGWAVGVRYSGKSNTLTLVSQVHVTLGGPQAARSSLLTARSPTTLTKSYWKILAWSVKNGTMQSEQATFFLGPDERSAAHPGQRERERNPVGDDTDQMHARADAAEMLLTGKQNLLHTATLTGNVHVERIGSQPMQGDAGRAILDFPGRNELKKCMPPRESICATPEQHRQAGNGCHSNAPRSPRIST